MIVTEASFPSIHPNSEGAIHWDKEGPLTLDLGTFPASVVSQIGGPSASPDWANVIRGHQMGTQTFLL